MMFLIFLATQFQHADETFFEDVVNLLKKYNIIVVHDFAYSELNFSGEKPISFLSIPGAKEVGVEFNSLSKVTIWQGAGSLMSSETNM